MINVDGSGHRRLTTRANVNNMCPSWSPHKTKILFYAFAEKHSKESTKATTELYAINVDGTGLTRLTNNKVDDYFPAWRPLAGK